MKMKFNNVGSVTVRLFTT